MDSVALPKLAIIAGSAGSLRAIKELFLNIGQDTAEVAFVLIQHRSPDHESMLASLLTDWTHLPAVEITEGRRLEPGRIHLGVAGKSLSFIDDALHLISPKSPNERFHPIDEFCRSVAEQNTMDLALVILSGTGSDGTKGAAAIKRAGGMVLAQDPLDADFNGMPNSAILSGETDHIQTVGEIASALRAWSSQPSHGSTMSVPETVPDDDFLRRILCKVHERKGNDMSGYKPATIRRRIARRMALVGAGDMASYLALLDQHPPEIEHLAQDMLIGVTEFFRDPEAFHILEQEVVPAICQAKAPKDPVRVWVAGCSTGEEAYSIAMLLFEWFGAHAQPPRIQIFATDIDEVALSTARKGRFNQEDLRGLNPTRIEQFFDTGRDGYCIKKNVRETIVFASHNLIVDPPFSKLDLVICRNVLIYLNAEVQTKLLDLFHFVLNPDGYLFLGSSESVGHQARNFRTISKPWRIYHNLVADRGQRKMPQIPVDVATFQRRGFVTFSEVGGDAGQLGDAQYYRSLLDRFGTAQVLVDGNNQVLFTSGNTAPFLEVPAGKPSLEIGKLARPSLGTILRSAIGRARDQRGKVTVNAASPDGDSLIRIEVSPLEETEPDALLVIALSQQEMTEQDTVVQAGSAGEIWVAQQFDRELNAVREDLQRTIEQSRMSGEELKAANEEVMAMNEELQSANEELESSKEELQSLNEELATTNTVLEGKVSELEILNADLTNLLNNSDTPTLLLDKELRIRRFTPACGQVMRVIPGDQGRYLDDIVRQFDDPELARDCALVMQGEDVSDVEVACSAGRWYLRKVLPYRSLEGQIVGVVLTMPDITSVRLATEALRQSEAQLRESESRYRQVTESLPQLVWTCTADGLCDYLSPQWVAYTGKGEAEQLGHGWLDQVHPDDRERAIDHWMATSAKGMPYEFEFRIRRHDGEYRWFKSLAQAVRNEAGEIIKWFGSSTDIENQKQVMDRLSLATKAGGVGIWDWDLQQNALVWDDQMYVLYGIPKDKFSGAYEAWRNGVHPDDLEPAEKSTQDALAGMRDYDTEFRVVRSDGTVRHIRAFGRVDRDSTGQATRMLGTNWDITESKQREADLARTTQRLLDNDLAMDSVGIGVSWVDEETGRFTYANRTLLQRLGYTAEEFTHLHVWDINPSFSSEQFCNHAETLQKSGSFKRNTLHRTKDGRDIPVEIIVYTRPPHDGLPSMRIVFQIDITERNASEFALESSEKQMRFVLEGAELGYWDWNIPTGTVDRNARWAEMLGYEHAEIQQTAKQWTDFIHPEDRSRAWESINAVLEGRSDSHRLEYRMLHKDGSVRWILDQAKVMQRDPDGKPLRMCGTHTDITSRKQSEATLIENEARYRHLIESLPDVAYTYSLSRGGIYYSPRATEVLGYPLDELLAQPQLWSGAIHPEDRPKVQGAVSRLLTQQEPFKLEYRIRDAKGNWHWLYDRSIGVRHVSNDALIDGLAMDITQTKKVQDELDQHRHHLEKLIEERTHELTLAKDAAEAAAKAKSEFLANMSHEIRTPLNGVLGLAQIGYRDSAGREKTKETFSQILDSGRLLLTIINDILDFSKIEAGKLPIESVPIAPGLLADEAIRNVTTLADRKHFKLSVEKIDLPAGCLGDPVRISQILLNLLANAIKFTEHGEVSLCARREGQQLIFAVRDTGIGILPETLVRLFQPFEQADSSVTRKFGGTGLGLVISRRLAELMGGSLTAESTPGQGSTFILHLPLKEAERPIVSGAVAVRGAKRLAGLNLLVAEDNAVNQIVIEDMLRGEGAEVTLVSTGQEALDTIEQASTPFDAVLMDVQMPELDGLEATRQLKQSHPDLQVIGQTAHALKEELDKCHAAGMVRTINKPIDLEIMVSTLLDLIHKPVQRLKVSEATTPLDEKGVVDWVALEQRFPNRAAFVERLMKMTLEGHAEDGNRLRKLATSGDLNEIQRLAHDWKCLAGNLCASDAESLAIRTMTNAKAGDNEALQLAQELASSVDRLILALRRGRPS